MKKSQIFPHKVFCVFVVAEVFLEVTLFLETSVLKTLLDTRLVDQHGWLTKENFGHSLFQ